MAQIAKLERRTTLETIRTNGNVVIVIKLFNCEMFCQVNDEIILVWHNKVSSASRV